MKMRSVLKTNTNCFSTRHQRSRHIGEPAVGEQLHFWVWNAWIRRHY